MSEATPRSASSLQPREAPGQVVRAEPRAQDVAALDGVDDRRLTRRQHLVQLGVRAGHLEAVLGARHLPLHHRPSSPAGIPTRSASAACARRRKRCAARRMSLHWKYSRSGMCSDDHSTFTPPFSSILKSREAGQRVERAPRPVVAAQVAVPQERVHRRVRVDVGQPGKRVVHGSADPLRQVVVHEHRGDQRPERIEVVVAPHELGVDEVDLSPVRLERDARGSPGAPRGRGGGRRSPPSRPASVHTSVRYMKLNFTM